MTLQAQLEALRDNTLKKIAQVAALKELSQIHVETLGKKGPITKILRSMKSLSPEERPVMGGSANGTHDLLTKAIETRKVVLKNEALSAVLEKESLDVTLPGKQMPQGTRHILTQAMGEIEDIFLGMGCQIVGGYRVGSDRYNFERMSLPKDHPARDVQDTFYISDETLIRTHASPAQVRVMEKHDFSKGTLRMISPGGVFHHGTGGATHNHRSHQIESLAVGKNVIIGGLRGALGVMAKKVFDEDRRTRLRPSYFLFTKPSVEVDVGCSKCGGVGHNACRHTGWVEISSVGMVHPGVLQVSGINPVEYSGFAFDLGPDRVAMLRYGVNNIRNLYQNDLCFLGQFKVKE